MTESTTGGGSRHDGGSNQRIPISLAATGIRGAADFRGRRIGVHHHADPLYRWFLARAGVTTSYRALDEEARAEVLARVLDDPMLDLDFVHLRFATKPGDRHVVEINGQDFGGFRKSDLKFLRMLLLAAARKHGKDDGWLDKSRLRDGSDKDPALNDLRADLGVR